MKNKIKFKMIKKPKNKKLQIHKNELLVNKIYPIKS